MSTLLTMVQGERLINLLMLPIYQDNFNPRSPWGERPVTVSRSPMIANFNPRSPWGERLVLQHFVRGRNAISIHALREESDAHGSRNIVCLRTFQSTLSVRRATQGHIGNANVWRISIHALREESDFFMIYDNMIKFTISIHALREESDTSLALSIKQINNFNPRSPWGERQFFLAVN